MPAPKYEMMTLRILADRSGSQGADGAWPVRGMEFGDRDNRSDPPKRSIVPTSSIQMWRDRGILTTEGSRIVVRPGGPPENPWKVDAEKGIPHMFEHLDRVVFHTMTHGDVVYEVVANPDKWPDRKASEGPNGEQYEEAGFGGEVRWYYDLKLVSSEKDEDEG
jgi:hypothetical protein